MHVHIHKTSDSECLLVDLLGHRSFLFLIKKSEFNKEGHIYQSLYYTPNTFNLAYAFNGSMLSQPR